MNMRMWAIVPMVDHYFAVSSGAVLGTIERVEGGGWCFFPVDGPGGDVAGSPHAAIQQAVKLLSEATTQ